MELVTPKSASELAQRQARWRLAPPNWLDGSLKVAALCVLVSVLVRQFTVSHLYLLMGPIEAMFTALFGLWLVWRVFYRWKEDDWRLHGLDILVIIMMLIPIWAAFGAKNVFGQPIFFGILVFKDYYLLVGALLIHRTLLDGFFTLRQLEKAFLILAWIGIIYFYAATLLTNPGEYLDTPLAGANTIKGGVPYYRFNVMLLYFGSIYYFAKAFIQRRWLMLVPAALFAGYVVFFRMDRSTMAITALGMLLAVALHVPARRILKVAMISVMPLVMALTLAMVFLPDSVKQYELMFEDAMATITGRELPGGKVSVRVAETAIAETYISRHPWTGSGRLDHTWEPAGYERWLGFFFPADIGYIGLIFIYGIPGALLLYMQFPTGLVYLTRVKDRNDDVFFITCKYMLLCLFLDSISTGLLTQNSGQVILFVCIAHAYYRLGRKEQPMPRSSTWLAAKA